MDSAGKMFEEMRCESMQKLIISVAKKTKPSSTFGLLPLDTHLASLAASRAEDPSPVDTIEIEGHPGSGKTQLLYHILSECITPKSYPPSSLGGEMKTAVLFDMDAQFDICRFRTCVAARMRQNFGLQSTNIVDRFLENLRIFNPTSTEQLLVTLARLPKVWRDHLPHSKLTIIAIHSLESLYWPDRFKAESKSRITTFPSRNSMYEKVYSCLRSMQEICETRVVLSHSGLTRVLQHHIPQRIDNQEPENLIENATSTGVNHGSTLFLNVTRVVTEPGLVLQTRGSCFRISGQASAEPEPIYLDIDITENEGVVVIQQGG